MPYTNEKISQFEVEFIQATLESRKNTCTNEKISQPEVECIHATLESNVKS